MLPPEHCKNVGRGGTIALIKSEGAGFHSRADIHVCLKAANETPRWWKGSEIVKVVIQSARDTLMSTDTYIQQYQVCS